MKKIIGVYAYPFIIIVGYCIIILISWFYSTLEIEDDSVFWASVLPSAFVDVISLVISTILITTIIDKKKVYNEKSRLYKIIKHPHKRIIDLMLLEYMYVIKNKHGNYYTKAFPVSNFEFENIEPYFRDNVHKDFQQDIIVLQKYRQKTEKAVTIDYIENEEVMRLKLMEDYQHKIYKEIKKYMNDYTSILTTDYLVILVEIKEELNSNPFWVYSFFGEEESLPAKIDVDRYIQSNQQYLNSIYKLIRYFDDIDTQAIWNEKEVKNEWGIIGIGAGILFVTFFLIKVGEFLVSL